MLHTSLIFMFSSLFAALLNFHYASFRTLSYYFFSVTTLVPHITCISPLSFYSSPSSLFNLLLLPAIYRFYIVPLWGWGGSFNYTHIRARAAQYLPCVYCFPFCITTLPPLELFHPQRYCFIRTIYNLLTLKVLRFLGVSLLPTLGGLGV